MREQVSSRWLGLPVTTARHPECGARMRRAAQSGGSGSGGSSLHVQCTVTSPRPISTSFLGDSSAGELRLSAQPKLSCPRRKACQQVGIAARSVGGRIMQWHSS